MTDPDAVARALARLASDPSRPREHGGAADPSPEHVVDDAEASMERVERAAAFLDSGGERRLRRVVRTVDADGLDTLTSRGRAVLRTLSRFRAVTDGETTTAAAGLDDSEAARNGDGPDDSETTNNGDGLDDNEARTNDEPDDRPTSVDRTTSTSLAQRSSGEGA